MKSEKRLRQLLRRQKVSTMEELKIGLEGRSKISIYRDFKELDYRSSYSHAGKYYTLSEIASFNEDGLWRYKGIGFSCYGTLKETVAHLVENSEAGYSHEELQSLLDVRVHNTLLDLVRKKRLKRFGQEKQYLYVSGDSKKSKEQHQRRNELTLAPTSAELVIEILSEVIRGSRICVEASALTEQLTLRGVIVTEPQVLEVLGLYGVKKTLDS